MLKWVVTVGREKPLWVKPLNLNSGADQKIALVAILTTIGFNMSEKTDDIEDIVTNNTTGDKSEGLTDSQKNFWIPSAEKNLRSAKNVSRIKEYVLAGFMCHLATEKAIKAIIAKNTNKYPPKIHSLTELAEIAGISSDLDDEQLLFLTELMPLNIEARYRQEKDDIYKTFTAEVCKDTCQNTEKFLLWIKKKL
ncbi:MAG: HEPN domain-containing protein [Endomicrobium sp.]|jgi:HEPN domain-containing protein|nr:HEPN domain-containing protein [Endomicrobium sp.]